MVLGGVCDQIGAIRAEKTQQVSEVVSMTTIGALSNGRAAALLAASHRRSPTPRPGWAAERRIVTMSRRHRAHRGRDLSGEGLRRAASSSPLEGSKY